MKKLLFLAVLLMPFSAMGADSLAGDITAQGNQSYLHKSVTAQQLGATIRDWETVTAVNTLTYAECGKTMFLNSATEFATTLPAVTDLAGCSFKFIVKAAPSGADYTIVTNASANLIIGGTNELEVDTGDDGPYARSDTPGDTISLKDGVAVVGDYVEVVTDGTYWYVTGSTNADGGLTLTST